MIETNFSDGDETRNTIIDNNIIPIESILPKELFIIPIRTKPVFPGIIAPIIVPKSRFSDAIDEAIKKNGFVGLSLLKEDESSKKTHDNIYNIGVAVKVFKKINLPDGSVNVLINSIKRFEITSLASQDPYIVANVDYPKETPGTSKNNIKALMRTLLVMTRELAQNNPLFTEEMKLTMLNVNEPGKMADFVCSILNLEKKEYQQVLEAITLKERIEIVLLYLKKEIDLVAIQRDIQKQINEKVDKQQRDFFLKEQLKTIQKELGITEEKEKRKYTALLERLKKANVEQDVIDEIQKEIDKFYLIEQSFNPESNIIRNYLDLIEALPWEEPKPKEIDIEKARKILDRDHYKLEDVKDRIIEFLAVKKLNPKGKGSIMLLVGPPGVGKTSIAKSIAEAMNRKFFRFSVGGMRDEAEIKGHRRTYIGALPGKIITALKISKEKDIVFLLDEIDKLSAGSQGDPSSALLEVLDPEQNKKFRDHYLDIPFDLSNVFFIATANTTDSISRILLDRMEVINLSGYITEEKVQIFQKYLWKKLNIENGTEKAGIRFDKKAVIALINSYSRESGVRGLEKSANKIVRKIATLIVQNKKIPSVINTENLKEYLGSPKFVDDRMTVPKVPGTALGLAWTAFGGSTLLIETMFVKGKENIVLTGMVGKTMNESASIALTHVKNLLKKDEIFENNTLHLHVPDGATPKDGPSAGITIATAILSLALNKVVKSGFGMTGELTLTGEVLAIGGLREKIVAAKRVGVKKIIFPKDNEINLEEIPNYVKSGVEFFPVNRFEEVVEILFGKIK